MMKSGICNFEPEFTVTTYTSGTELQGPPVHFGNFQSERDARQALADAGFTNGEFGWRLPGGYTSASIVEKVKYFNHRHDPVTRRAMEMNAELPQATYDMLKLKGMI